MEKGGYVYMMTTVDNTALYTGVTSDLRQRYFQHLGKRFPDGFTAKYNCIKLVYFCHYGRIEDAIAEEKRIKGGSRKKKEALVASINPLWKDLGKELFGEG